MRLSGCETPKSDIKVGSQQLVQIQEPDRITPQISKDEGTSPLRKTNTVVSETIPEVPEKTSKRTLTNNARESEPNLSKSKSNIASLSETSHSRILIPKKIIHVPKIDLNKSRRISDSKHTTNSGQPVPGLPLSKLSKTFIQQNSLSSKLSSLASDRGSSDRKIMESTNKTLEIHKLLNQEVKTTSGEDNFCLYDQDQVKSRLLKK